MNTTELDLNTLFPFSLDDFQLQAIAALDAQKSVVVCAPTGSGKTIIAEYAIHRALMHGRRVFYTTPLKALSNQKLRDFQEQFGASIVGLITGDTLINVNAPIVVMTTEVFRNMLYDTPIGQVGTSTEDVEVVVLDECHYLSDRQRGTVWEESIIYCPPQIQIVALSATVGNPEQLTDWMSRVHGATELVNSDFRPVPLRFYFVDHKGIHRLLDPKNQRLNPELKGKSRKGNSRRRCRQQDCPTLVEVIAHLQEREMLPAIYLIFSRKGCDQAVEELSQVSLVTEAEARQLQESLDQFMIAHPEAVRAGQGEALINGIAAHHAGILPAWKEFVETLFELGLIKVVFATATLAAGINMPARTTVISTLSKRSDNGHRLLYPSEFLQISGRAGRRGMDSKGNVITLQTPFEGAKEAAYLATAAAESLRSWFTPSYGMVLNLLQTHSIEEVERLLERSFAEYLALLKLAPEQQAIAEKNTELARLDIELAPIEAEQFENYEKLKERLREERRLLKILQQQAEASKTRALSQQLRELDRPRVVYLKGKHIRVSKPLPALFITQVPGRGQAPYFLCLGSNNNWYVVSSADVMAITPLSEAQKWTNLEELIPPPKELLKPGRCAKGDVASATIASKIGDRFEQIYQEAPEVREQQIRLTSVQTQLDEHPLEKWGNPRSLIKRHHRRLSLREEIHQHQLRYRKHQSNQSYYWQDFLNLVEVLQEFNALGKYTPTALGRTAAAIRGDNELWLGLALRSGNLDHLEPHHLAAAVCALITETPRPDSWTNYPTSEIVLETLAQLREMRRQLFQLQRRHHIALPVWLEFDLVGLVEHWAQGEEVSDDWLELCENTSLDEGDLVRMLRRTADVLWQLPQIPGLSVTLQRSARQAIAQMRRFPV